MVRRRLGRGKAAPGLQIGSEASGLHGDGQWTHNQWEHGGSCRQQACSVSARRELFSVNKKFAKLAKLHRSFIHVPHAAPVALKYGQRCISIYSFFQKAAAQIHQQHQTSITRGRVAPCPNREFLRFVPLSSLP